MVPRRLAVLLVVATSLLLGSCADDKPARPARPDLPPVDRADAWREVDLDGEVRSIVSVYDHLVAAGLGDDGKPLLVGVDEDIPDLTLLQPPAWSGGARGVSSDGLNIMVSEGNDPAAGRPSRLWLADDYSSFDLPEVHDREGRKPVWLDPLLDGEEDSRLLGAVRVEDEWRLHAWEATNKWEYVDNGPQLYLDGPPSSDNIASGTTETSVIVAGQIGDRPDVPAGSAGAWFLFSDYSFSGIDWERLPLRPAPDSLSDVASWDVGFWIAGQRDLKPVVYDFDTGEGHSMDTPDTALDAARPKVLVANLPVAQDDRLILATQSEAGPTLWVQTDEGWTDLGGPAGNLEAAEIVERSAYLLIDGQLWWRELPFGLIPDPWSTESASPSVSGSSTP